ncbi:MAG TPA: NAD-dependent succinate-semialdehyde dehydrogenase [Armatimonadota bacterium]|nr:NAD-dependent succinate-semialdehyde dehydrogenase [Armatimonadota bacterium]
MAMSPDCALYIGGEFCAAASGRTEAVINPATEEPLAHVPYGDATDARRALDAAAQALGPWGRMNAWERGAILRRAADLIRERAPEIARTMSSEVGKPVPESLGETLAAAAQFEWMGEEGKRVYGRWVPPSRDGVRRWVLHQPVGVCAAATAWNFPLLLPARKIAAATAAGCTIVARPSIHAPLAAMQMVACLHEAGFPPGVINHVLGPARELMGVFMDDPRCRKVSFTGSTEVGKQLMQGAAGQVKKLSLELGGSAPVLIFPDVDVERVAAATVQAKFRNNGQVCIAAARFYVHQSIYDEYVREVVRRAEALVVGDPMQEGTHCGPLFAREAVERMMSLVDDARTRGARILAGGRPPEGAGFERGFWFLPTVLDQVPPGARLRCEETFGPLMPLFRFGTVDEAIREANDTPYGLAAYVFTRDLSRAIEVCEALRFGIVGLNDMVPATAECPFGGMKESGMGREGGAEGIAEYLETQYVSVGMA